MADSQSKRPPHWSDVMGINFRLIGILLVVGVILFFAGRHAYKGYLESKDKHLLEQAAEFHRKKDHRSAVLSLRQVMSRDPDNLTAIRLMAELSDEANSPSALLWRQRVCELNPADARDRLALADTAIRQGQLRTADQALLALKPEERKTVQFHRTAGALALKANQMEAARRHFEEVHKLEPGVTVNSLNLASVQLQSRATSVVAEARKTLETLVRDEKYRVLGMRALLADAQRSKQTNRVIELARSLSESPGSSFRDRMYYADSLSRAGATNDFSKLWDRLRADAKSAGDISEMMFWLNANARARETITWMQSLPEGTADLQPIPIAVSEARILVKDWPGLRSGVEKADWRELDFMRLAFQSRAEREMDENQLSHRHWRAAVTQVDKSPIQMHMLARLAWGWKWETEAEDLWWRVLRQSTIQPEALSALHRLYSHRKDTRKLLRVSNAILEFEPEDRVAGNNAAILSMLLNESLAKAHQIAKDNFEKFPKNPIFASTYAYSLHLQGRSTEGTELLSKFPDSQLRHPSMAALYGVILAGAGDVKKAKEYLGLADGNTALFPEEQLLVTQVLRQIAPKVR